MPTITVSVHKKSSTPDFIADMQKKPTILYSTAAQDYTAAVDFFMSIKESQLHIVAAHVPFNQVKTLELLWAMMNNVPIICDLPAFTNECNPYCKEIILSKMDKLYLYDLDRLDNQDRKALLADIGPTNYVLTNQQRTFIKSQLREYFRSLL